VTAHWESATLSHVAVPPAVLAEEVATDLCEPSRIVTEVLVECLETLDAALELEASELLADYLRWQAGRLAVVAPQVTDEEVVAAISSAVQRHAGPEVVEEGRRHLGGALAAGGEEPVPGDPPLPPKAQAYLDHVLRG